MYVVKLNRVISCLKLMVVIVKENTWWNNDLLIGRSHGNDKNLKEVVVELQIDIKYVDIFFHFFWKSYS